jgi:trehalose/maltose hydrolase-like predicted phosphorylase
MWMRAAVALTLIATPLPAQDSTFLLSTADPTRAPSPFIGNGSLGVVVPALGVGPGPSFVAGLYEEAQGDVPRIAAIPDWTGVGVFDGERWLDSTAIGTLRDYHQVLDLRSGTIRTSYDWTEGSRTTGVAVETFVSRADPHLAVVRLELTPRQSGRMRARFAIAGRPPPPRLALARLEQSDPAWKPADVWYPGHMRVRSRDASVRGSGGSLAVTSTPEGRKTTLAQAAEVWWDATLPGASARSRTATDSAWLEVAFDGRPGQTSRFVQVMSAIASTDGSFPLTRAVQEAALARARGYDSVATANARAWERRWETDIRIEGDPELQRVVRSMLFYLLASADRLTAMGVPPMGLSSGGYYGHVFWDSDTWMFPPLLATHPDIAHSLVAFRGRTLGAARERAREHGFRGAMYPWEADERGRETTPRFAIQNATSEIHVTGDVALAQWQYYLATGDSAWLARDGYPVLRETADFWVSRSVYDSAAGRYHIENVVSVHEGLIGVTDDAYTNAVARKNLEIATEASRRLGRPAPPEWARVATRLHLPYDSASRFYRTYEGAPDSTLGAVTPLLAYPLGVPMEEPAKRAQLEQAVKRLLAEGPGAMMGSTILSVDAVELGDQRMLDSLLSHSYRPHLKGPFLMLSETPTNDAVNFVTGAGGFLQQVIFGWTGLRIGDGGLDPAYPALLPSHIRRLTLRNVHARGKRFDVVVDSSGRRIIPREGGPAGVPPGRRLPVLEFPEPGVDDTAAYAGYRTRFYRDSRNNTVQIYLEPRGARVVNLLANAANESIGFTVRDDEGRPASLAWGEEAAQVADSGGLHRLEYSLVAGSPRVELGWFILGSMRVERDFQYWRRHLEPFTAPPFRVAEESLLVAEVGSLPDAARPGHLAALNASTPGELRERLLPAIVIGPGGREWLARIERPSLDGRNRLVLEIRGDTRSSEAHSAGRTVLVRARSGSALRLRIRIATDAAGLTPLSREEIFNRDFLEFLSASGDRRLERDVRGVELLSSREKLMAGLPNFATYFGRDMMMTALMMRPIWTPAMSEHVIAGVLRKLGPEGDVSHEEALGGQAIRENAVVYDSLVRTGRLDAARQVLADLQATRENYHMIDDEFQLPVLVARYLADTAVSGARKREFLLEGAGASSRLELLLRELALVAAWTRPYVEAPRPTSLVSFPRRDATHWRSASWRDSDAGYAGGRFAMDVNAIWAPQALEATGGILASLRELGFRAEALDSIAPGIRGTALQAYARDSDSLARALAVWRRARRHFEVRLSPAQVRERVRARLAALPPEEREYWSGRVEAGGADRDSLRFLALSLDEKGKPLPVVSTDPATGLFLDRAASSDEVDLYLEPIMQPYPVGLFVDSLGPLVANDAYAPRQVWDTFEKDRYHSPRVVWGREVNLLMMGLMNHRPALERALRKTREAVAASGLQHNELWSYRIEGGKLVPVRYGTSSDVQLWSSTSLAVQFAPSRLPGD